MITVQPRQTCSETTGPSLYERQTTAPPGSYTSTRLCFGAGWPVATHKRSNGPTYVCSCLLITHPLMKIYHNLSRKHRPLRLQPGASGVARAQHVSGAATTRRGAATTTMQEGASSAGVEVGEISGKRLFVEFAAFGFFKRNCQLELRANGDSVISKGMVTPENGAWRIEVRVQQ